MTTFRSKDGWHEVANWFLLYTSVFSIAVASRTTHEEVKDDITRSGKIFRAESNVQVLEGSYLVQLSHLVPNGTNTGLVAKELVEGCSGTVRIKYVFDQIDAFSIQLEKDHEVEEEENHSTGPNPEGWISQRRTRLEHLLPLVNSPWVERIEEDHFVAFRHPEVNRLDPVDENDSKVGAGSWGLDRINQRDLPLDGNSEHNYDGRDVDVYVLDTGINLHHDEFALQGDDKDGTSRIVSCSWNSLDGNPEMKHPDCADGSGHGTHVAGIVAGRTFGVAPRANLYAIKVLDEKAVGTLSAVVDGLNYLARQAASSNRTVVGNLALGGIRSHFAQRAIAAVVQAGAFLSVAASNDGRNDCWTEATSDKKRVIHVGAVDARDQRLPFSSWGSCVDIYAPGHNIMSAWIEDEKDNMPSNSTWRAESGTDTASPHVAGVAALLLQQNPTWSAEQVRQNFFDLAAPGRNSSNEHLSRILILSIEGLGIGIPITNSTTLASPLHNSSDSASGVKEGFVNSLSFFRRRSPDSDLRVEPTGSVARRSRSSTGKISGGSDSNPSSTHHSTTTQTSNKAYHNTSASMNLWASTAVTSTVAASSVVTFLWWVDL